MSYATRKLKDGNVLQYDRERYHCREGIAVVDGDRAFDTYWSSDRHVLTYEELKTAKVLFNVSDYDALDAYAAYSRTTWETYHPDDRERITSQHGLQERLFIRKGAQPDLATQIENAEERVAAAESELRVAQGRLDRRREDLDELRRGPDAKREASNPDGIDVPGNGEGT